MAKIDRLFVSEATAAQMLDLTVAQFRTIRAAGAIPPPKQVGHFERFDVDDLRSVIRGEPVAGAMEW